MTTRWDETWHRLRDWTNGQGPSERLAALVLHAEGYEEIDPTHPLGGPDGGKDAMVIKSGQLWVMAAYFPRGQQTYNNIATKAKADAAGVARNDAYGLVFVTNQELTAAERTSLADEVGVPLDLVHLERLTTVLDRPGMESVRTQFLGEYGPAGSVKASDFSAAVDRLAAVQTGGDSFCYWMLYNFDLAQAWAKEFVVIRKGEYPLYDVRLRIRDMDAARDVFEEAWGEINAPADYRIGTWRLPPDVYYRVFVHARNGNWHQDLILRRSDEHRCWLAATRVWSDQGERYRHLDTEFESTFGPPEWRD